VLRPFAELNPDFWHPVAGMTLSSLWQRYDAASQPLTPVQLDWHLQPESEATHV
jgi:2-amino-4-hydroxy-6-hydroxymethyldihydropteridine diphosphokinase